MEQYLFCGLFGLTNFHSMLKHLLNNKFRVFILGTLVLGLALIRIVEESLFYDPYLDYFKSDFINLPLPIVDKLKLFSNLLFRYSLNTIVSIAFIQIAFKDINFTKFVSALYVLLFIVLIIVFYFVLAFYAEENKMTLFYIRRFLIQPLFLLLFIPGYLIQKRLN
jgi:exosortase F-associated protein